MSDVWQRMRMTIWPRMQTGTGLAAHADDDLAAHADGKKKSGSGMRVTTWQRHADLCDLAAACGRRPGSGMQISRQRSGSGMQAAAKSGLAAACR
jgi:hypothetical protein